MQDATLPTAAPAQAPTPNQIRVSPEMSRGASPAEVLTAARAQRTEFRNQLESLEDRRDNITRELTNDNTTGVDRQGLEARLKAVDARISSVEGQIAQADQAVAATAAIPGAVQITRPPQRSGPPDGAFAIPIVFTLAVLMPIAIAYSRRIWRRGATVIAPVPRELQDRLEQMGQAVESIAVEVERIGEGQRFLTRVMSESGKPLGAGAAQPIPVRQAENQPVHQAVVPPEYRASE